MTGSCRDRCRCWLATSGAGETGCMRVVVTHIWGSGTVVSRTVDAAGDTGDVPWGELASRALANPPPYRPFPGGAICHIQVDDQVVMVAERDLAGPLLDLVAAVLDRADAESVPPSDAKLPAGQAVKSRTVLMSSGLRA